MKSNKETMQEQPDEDIHTSTWYGNKEDRDLREKRIHHTNKDKPIAIIKNIRENKKGELVCDVEKPRFN